MDRAHSTSAARDNLVSNLKAVIRDAEELLKSTGQQVDEGYQSARARFESSLSSAKSGLDNAQESVLARTKDAMHSTDDYVHDNPWRSVGVAAIAGVVIGLLLGRE
jgi:ElaB/YqjD/DUF883 family membrane-anchored ribosome-binding protein